MLEHRGVGLPAYLGHYGRPGGLPHLAGREAYPTSDGTEGVPYNWKRTP
jgi:hypothetical protein